jgi:N-acetylneuraminic acid mutarotase
MFRLGKTFAFVVILAVVPTTALAASSASTLAGTWHRLPATPITPSEGLTSVWTGRQMLLFGRVDTLGAAGSVAKRVNVATAYDSRTNTWRRLPALGPTHSFMEMSSVWTGKEMLVWGQGTHAAFNPATSRWRQLPGSRLLAIHDGFTLVVWTGREMIGWGGGCCGDAFSDGVAYNPATNTWRALAPSPLAGSAGPIGAWTGRELIVLGASVDPDGKPYPAHFARAAAYNPTTNTWRRITAPPVRGGVAVWDGHDLLVVGGGTDGRSALTFNPATNRWRRLASLPSGRFGSAVAWTGSRLLLWGGYEYQNGTPTGRGYPIVPPHGLAYDPATDRWSALPQAPLVGRLKPTGVWTGKSLIVWGGSNPKKPLGTGTQTYADGAAFKPAA